MKSADTGTSKMFELEMLEPRILLSGAPHDDLIGSDTNTTVTLPATDDVGSIQRSSRQQTNAAAVTPSAPQQVDGIFAGVDYEELNFPDEIGRASCRERV